MMMLRSHAWLLIPTLLAGPANNRPAPVGMVHSMSLSSSGGTARFAIGVSGPVTIREVTYTDPDRLVIDLEGATLGDLDTYDGLRRGAVRAVRAKQHTESVVRLVLEFDRLPAYTLDKGTAGVITVAYADRDFEKWSARPGQVPAVRPILASASAEPRELAAGPMRSTQMSSAAVQLRDETRQDDRRITVDFDRTPINEVIRAFAKVSGRSIVLGAGVKGEVDMTIVNQPWPFAFEAVLASQGLSATEMRGGIIRVDSPGQLASIDSVEVLQTQLVRLNYSRADGVAAAVQGLITSRGRIVADTLSNSLIITDTRSRIANVVDFVRGMDVRTPMIAIEGKIIYVDRTDLEQLGLKYDIGTSQQFFNRILQRCCDPATGQPYNPNINVVNLGGNAVSAVSNADAIITGSALDLIFSTAIGGFSVTSFLSALERVELTDVEATPLVHTLDHQRAQILSGEETPVRVIDASSIGQVGQAPRANVTFKQTGIQLTVTPHVTNNRQIVLEIFAERSSIQPLAAADLGFTIPTQRVVTRLLVEDGETAVSGGLSVTTVTRNRAGIPLLSGLPFIGPLFSFSENRENRRDLIILVTPRILDDAVPLN
ncbi:MAG: AMIN domain-containing protein [Gemmatimonadales bacterium]|nr:AMIN domain-containing protein [Gemmatimonadales bacterium]